MADWDRVVASIVEHMSTTHSGDYIKWNDRNFPAHVPHSTHKEKQESVNKLNDKAKERYPGLQQEKKSQLFVNNKSDNRIDLSRHWKGKRSQARGTSTLQQLLKGGPSSNSLPVDNATAVLANNGVTNVPSAACPRNAINCMRWGPHSHARAGGRPGEQPDTQLSGCQLEDKGKQRAQSRAHSSAWNRKQQAEEEQEDDELLGDREYQKRFGDENKQWAQSGASSSTWDKKQEEELFKEEDQQLSDTPCHSHGEELSNESSSKAVRDQEEVEAGLGQPKKAREDPAEHEDKRVRQRMDFLESKNKYLHDENESLRDENESLRDEKENLRRTIQQLWSQLEELTQLGGVGVVPEQVMESSGNSDNGEMVEQIDARSQQCLSSFVGETTPSIQEERDGRVARITPALTNLLKVQKKLGVPFESIPPAVQHLHDVGLHRAAAELRDLGHAGNAAKHNPLSSLCGELTEWPHPLKIKEAQKDQALEKVLEACVACFDYEAAIVNRAELQAEIEVKSNRRCVVSDIQLNGRMCMGSVAFMNSQQRDAFLTLPPEQMPRVISRARRYYRPDRDLTLPWKCQLSDNHSFEDLQQFLEKYSGVKEVKNLSACPSSGSTMDGIMRFQLPEDLRNFKSELAPLKNFMRLSFELQGSFYSVTFPYK